MKNKQINAKLLESMMTSSRKLLSLPEDFALWLIYRRTIGKPIHREIVLELRKDLSYSKLDNFFSKKYGILSIESSKRTWAEIYKKCGIDKRPSDAEIEAMISSCEEEYGAEAEAIAKKRGGRKSFTKG